MIESIKDLQKLISLCQKNGVKSIKLGEVSLEFGDISIVIRLYLGLQPNQIVYSIGPGFDATKAVDQIV